MDFKEVLAGCLNTALGQEIVKKTDIETPPEEKMGDFAFPCFKLSKTLRKAPPAIAADIAEKLVLPDFIDHTEIAGGYLNFYADKNALCMDMLTSALSDEQPFKKRDETVIIEYSSPNIAKPFHIGHLCSTVIGDSLSRIYKTLGYDIVRINYLGDYGTQFGKLIAAYKHWGDEQALEQDPIVELFRIYVKFHEEAEKDPALEDEGRMYFKNLEQGNAEEVALWERFKKLSLEKFSEIYNRLGVEFDSYAGESFYSDKMDAVVEELKEKGLLTLSDGAQVVDLEAYNMPPCIILKSDGATIYATRDIAAALYRKKTYNFAKCLYVVGLPQALHFSQFFKVLELMGYEWSRDCRHVGFAHVKFPDGKMSTRGGKVVFLEDVLDEAVRRAREKMEESENTKPDNIDDASEKVGIGAMKFAFLKSSREREILFSWEETLDFNGESGPYVQYTYARAKSILRKCGTAGALSQGDFCREEESVLKTIDGFSQAVLEAAEKNEPSVIARYVCTLAKAFNRFYNACPVAGSAQQEQRCAIVEATAKTIQKSLSLLGIESLEKM